MHEFSQLPSCFELDTERSYSFSLRPPYLRNLRLRRIDHTLCPGTSLPIDSTPPCYKVKVITTPFMHSTPHSTRQRPSCSITASSPKPTRRTTQHRNRKQKKNHPHPLLLKTLTFPSKRPVTNMTSYNACTHLRTRKMK